MTHCADKQTLLATSGDGTLSAFDMRTRKILGRSDQQDDELLSVVVLKVGLVHLL